VQVFDGSTPVGTVQVDGGRATLVVPGAAVGKHSYRATFVPSTTDFARSTSAQVALTVRRVASKTTLTVPTKAKAGSRPTIKVKVVREDTDDPLQDNVVISQAPDAGTEAKPGSTMMLTVGRGTLAGTLRKPTPFAGRPAGIAT